MNHLGRRQADILRDLGWDRARVSRLYHSQQAYSRADVEELSRWLGIQPYELLLLPAEAIALRNLRTAAATITAQNDAPPTGPPAAGGPIPPTRVRAVGAR
jgi:hypothetical protein